MKTQFFKKVAVATTALGLMVSSAIAKPADWPAKVTFGVVPVAGAASVEAQFGDLSNYLEKKLGIQVDLQTTSDYTGIITGLSHNHIDIAYLGPNSYVTATQRAKVEAIVMELSDKGVPGYHGLIIASKKSGIKTLEDLKGKKFAFTDPQSTSGTLVPTVMFSKKGIDPQKYFSKVIYAGSHEAAALAVKAGQVDASSNNDLDFERGIGKRWTQEDFTIVWKSDLIPGSPIAVRTELPTTLKKAIKDAFIAYKVPKNSPLKTGGYTSANDATYNPTRELKKAKEALKNK